MTVSSSTARADYNGNGSTTAFTVPFYFLSSSHLLVISTVIATGVSTTLVLNSDYTVTGAGVPAGGTVTTSAAPATGVKLSILRNVPITQTYHYVPNDPFPAASHENAIDLLTMEVQQVNEVASRAVTLPPSTSGVSTLLPSPSANAAIGWDPTATFLTNLTTIVGSVINSFWTPILLTSTSASAKTALGITDAPFLDTNPLIKGSADATKLVRFEVDGLTTATTRVATVPDKNFTIAGLDDIPTARTDTIVRQSVQYGAVTSTGLPDLITQAQVGATLATGVTLAGTWMASVGNGFNTDGSPKNLNKVRTASLNVPNLTGSVTNYIWYDTVADTAGFVTVADSFQYAGTIPVTANQYTYDYVNHIMYLGNGATATQSNRIIVAEVDTSATNITAIRVRAYAGQYDSGFTATLVGGAGTFSKNHNMGTKEFSFLEVIECTTTDIGYAVGDTLDNSSFSSWQGSIPWNSSYIKGKNTIITRKGNTSGYYVSNATTGIPAVLTAANWKYKVIAKRLF